MAYVEEYAGWIDEAALIACEPGTTEISDEIATKYDVFGWTATSIDYETVRLLARGVHEKNGDCKQVLGGAHATAMEGNPRHLDWVFDAFVIGEGEKAFLKCLVDIQYDHIRWPQRYYTEYVENLDELPFPRRPHVETQQLMGGETMGATIMTSRGCPHNCAFCASKCMWPTRVRWRSPADVVAEMLMLRERGVTDFSIIDDNMTLNDPWLREFCKLVKPLMVRWRGLSRVDRVNRERCVRMREAGCVDLCLGVESFDQKVLDALEKGTTTKQCMDAIITAHDCELQVRVMMMIGTPGESYKGTVALNVSHLHGLEDCIDLVTLYTMMPLPGSPIWEAPHVYDIEIVDRDFSKYNRWWWSPEGANAPWSPIRIKGMTYEQQLENIQQMRNYVASLPQMNTGRVS
jgi:radical SAM superfamily enzyme YgiQ (UPF0313 family)